MSNHSTAGDAAWQPFVDALCTAASTWDADLARFSGGGDVTAPISSAQAENVMLALAALAQRMARAAASIVRAIADAGLESAEDELSEQVESLGRMALCVEAMDHAAEMARAVVNDV
ncbi:hypothetical protein [Lentzea cavernae]|uniref:Uncharacterized protein n=1 Tax=Lentzea cavernae TaxID=2020703 RepID=A0ABQ3MEH4_9PSEU|nr:hypothetical protein [Lentzea cavernae]GHH40311.1 hypothetical protein GCM10017774_33490 [Lentzea cavernae]